ncbi:hypothetical protein BS78_03G108100 [Paspalum vaginatum]|nr:hypothetical protein BS78_03G108100 [Paspalum vaginatum]
MLPLPSAWRISLPLRSRCSLPIRRPPPRLVLGRWSATGLLSTSRARRRHPLLILSLRRASSAPPTPRSVAARGSGRLASLAGYQGAVPHRTPVAPSRALPSPRAPWPPFLLCQRLKLVFSSSTAGPASLARAIAAGAGSRRGSRRRSQLQPPPPTSKRHTLDPRWPWQRRRYGPSSRSIPPRRRPPSSLRGGLHGSNIQQPRRLLHRPWRPTVAWVEASAARRKRGRWPHWRRERG